MSFNQSKYNSAKYNVTSVDVSSLRLVTARGLFTTTKPLLKRSSQLYLKPANGVSQAIFMLKVNVPLSLPPAHIVSNGRLNLILKVPLVLKTAGGIFSANKGLYIRMFELVTINLSGLILYPGETLTIDTDKITVEKNGVSVIEFWQTGSKPFYFVNGENILSYYDNDTKRKAEMLVIWRERWL
jgi:hypothetical protein